VRIDARERRARLVARQRLAPSHRAPDALEAARSVVALHSTDAATVFLSVRARTDGVVPADIERALYDDRTLVRVLCMRRTLFVVPRDLVPVVFAACTRTIAARERRRLEKFVADSGISTRPGAWITRASNAGFQAVESRGAASTSDIVADVPMLAKRLRFGIGTKFEATQSVAARILPQLAMEGRLVRARPRGTWVSGQYRWTPMVAWLSGELERLDPAAAQAELLRRWLAAFGPGTETDIRWWTGWTAREARAALAAVPHAEVDLDGSTGYVLAGDLEPTPAPVPSVAFLSTLDPTTMGWKERDWYLGPHAAVLFDSNGNAGPTVWWDGRVVGGWSQRRDGEIVFRLLEDVGAEAVRAVEAEAARVAGWLGDARFSPGFLPPFQRALAEMATGDTVAPGPRSRRL
jgi:hypothetical protein